MKRVSANCLRGEPVPPDLATLWELVLEDDADLLHIVEMELVDELDDDFFEGYRAEDGVPPESVRAHRRMFEQVAFIARTVDGGLLGYWLGEEDRPVADSPVVELNNEGQYELKGMSVAEYLLQARDAEVELVREWLEERGVPVTVKSQKDVWKKLKRFGDPNKQSWRYQKEEGLREG